jgi:hypothetical protein
MILWHLLCKYERPRRGGTQQYRQNPQKLSAYRLELTVKFHNEEYPLSDNHLLHHLIDWLMPLPDDLKIQFRNQLQQRLPDKTMPHITLFEELALKEGLEKGIVQTAREAILDVLDTRFGQVPDSLRERVNAIGGERNLKDLHRRAILTPSLEEFQATL